MSKRILRKCIIYTDGACSPNPGNGGWGALIQMSDYDIELSGVERNTTNNRMEMLAAVEALKALDEPSSVTLITDSKYLRDGITKWINGWRKNGWKTRDRKPVKNQDLWILLDELTERHSVIWQWVKGHHTCKGNITADKLAVKARENMAKLKSVN